jgi:NAD(P)-dependent dehydrogenase (short-subunit alcohol dehydrogenase family)
VSLDGKVAFISGGARGMGRAHAVALAAEGADIITFDLCGPVATCRYPPATPADLAETVSQVEALDRRIVARTADVRDEAAVRGVLAEGIAALGRLDIVVANAGIAPFIGEVAHTPAAWQDALDALDALDAMLTGVLHTIEPAVPILVEQGSGGSDSSRFVTSTALPVDAGNHAT